MLTKVNLFNMANVLLAVAVALLPVVSAFRSYPRYMQCDPRWGNNPMGVDGPGERSTICGEGCAMSCLSSGLAGLGATINGQTPSPATLNAWLEANNGYECLDGDCNNLILNAVTRLNATITLIGEVPTPSVASIQQGLQAGNTLYLAHVRDRSHFVLLTGFDANAPNAFTVMDPYYNCTSYPVANISDIIMYSVNSEAPATENLRGKLVVNSASVNRYGVAGPERYNPRVMGTSPVIPFSYPLYKQCDSRWGSDLIETETICAVGCLLSSISMAIGGKNITVNKAVSNPGVFNDFMRAHNGYTSGNDLEESVVPQVNPSHISWPSDGMHTTNDIPIATIQSMLKAGRPVIANVMNGGHFILITGWDSAVPDTLYVNDPGFSRLTYSYSKDVVGWRLFDMEACPKGC